MGQGKVYRIDCPGELRAGASSFLLGGASRVKNGWPFSGKINGKDIALICYDSAIYTLKSDGFARICDSGTHSSKNPNRISKTLRSNGNTLFLRAFSL